MAEIFDLDVLRPAPVRVRFGGQEHELVPCTLERIEAFSDLQKRIEEARGDAAAELRALRALATFIAPTADLAGATPEQRDRLIRLWFESARTQQESTEKEALAVASDPTSPG